MAVKTCKSDVITSLILIFFEEYKKEKKRFRIGSSNINSTVRQ
jgi:hypothetical protein